jgi:hypothetical protein
MTMPFGKYKGMPFDQLPDHYIHWLVTEFEGTRPFLRQQLEEELERRKEADRAERQQRQYRKQPGYAAHTNGGPPAHLREWIDEIVRRGYKSTAFKAHPDQGGSDESMKQLNEAKQWLERLVG